MHSYLTCASLETIMNNQYYMILFLPGHFKRSLVKRFERFLKSFKTSITIKPRIRKHSPKGVLMKRCSENMW